MNIKQNRIMTDERTQRLNSYSQMRRDQVSIKKLAIAMKKAKGTSVDVRQWTMVMWKLFHSYSSGQLYIYLHVLYEYVVE